MKKPGCLCSPIPLEHLIEIIDWQVCLHEGDDKQALIKACNVLFDHIHRNDPDEEHGN
jgi:hypothetical protein